LANTFLSNVRRILKRHARRSIRIINRYLDNATGVLVKNMIMLDFALLGYKVKYVANGKTKHYDTHAQEEGKKYTTRIKQGPKPGSRELNLKEVKEASKIADSIRKPSPTGWDSTAEIRKWRDTRRK
jgi:hypothetical protein